MTEFADIVVDLFLDGRIGWRDADRLMLATEPTPADLIVVFFYRLFAEADRDSLPRALGHDRKARPWELLELGVSGLTCDGEDLPTLDEGELRRRMETASRLSLESPSAWLATYAARLVAESRRRKGVGRSA